MAAIADPVTVHRKRGDGWPESFMAEVAKLPRGLTLRRQQPCGRCGLPIVTLEEFDPAWAKRNGDWDRDGSARPDRVTWASTAYCQSCKFLDQLATLGGIVEYAYLKMTADVQKFRAAFPAIADVLLAGVRGADPFASAVFPVGPISSDISRPALAARPDWLELVQRHAAGDFGEVGTLGEVGRLEPLVIWSEPIQARDVRNAITIEAGVGLVVSRYQLPTAGKAEPEASADAVVATLLSPAGPKTAAWVLPRSHPSPF